jgi:TPR repeat protein
MLQIDRLDISNWRLTKGIGVSQDSAEAARYFKLAADHGDSSDKVNYGERPLTGDGVPQDSAEAASYLLL